MKARHRYLVYGLVIESELPLTSVHEAAGDDGCADITLLAGSPDYFRAIVPAGARDPEDWIEHVVLDDGSVYMKPSDVFAATISATTTRHGTLGCGCAGRSSDRPLAGTRRPVDIAAGFRFPATRDRPRSW